MSITVNVKDVGLRELVALYYNDNGTIREFKEVWTNDGDEVGCLFKKNALTWTGIGDYAVVNSVDNNGYSVNFKDLMTTSSNESNSGIRSNLLNLSQGKIITVDFTRTSTLYTLITFIKLLDSNGNVVQGSDSVIGTTSNTVTLTVASSGEYRLALFAALTDGGNGWYQSTVDAEIIIK